MSSRDKDFYHDQPSETIGFGMGVDKATRLLDSFVIGLV
jgi:hypothetical protein